LEELEDMADADLSPQELELMKKLENANSEAEANEILKQFGLPTLESSETEENLISATKPSKVQTR
jgi:hypothetical protein